MLFQSLRPHIPGKSREKNKKIHAQGLTNIRLNAPIGPQKLDYFGGLNMITKNFRFTVELKADIHDSPKGVGSREEFGRIQRLAQRIAANDETLIEVYKITFFDLLFGDYYSDEINRRIKPKAEDEFILPVAEKMDPHDSTFFSEFFSQVPKKDSNIDRDNVLNLFYSQFGRPKIVEVRFESA
jgi:hypothetical protein